MEKGGVEVEGKSIYSDNDGGNNWLRVNKIRELILAHLSASRDHYDHVTCVYFFCEIILDIYID